MNTNRILPYEGGALIGERVCGNGGTLRLYGNTDANAFLTYVERLTAEGYRLLAENRIGENLYRTMTDEQTYLHLSYTAWSNTVRVAEDPMDRALLPGDLKPMGEKVTEPTLAVLSLDYSHREILDGNGMAYAVILEDGRYVLMDGGYTVDAHRLYNFLADNNRRKDGRIVIAAWLLSHSHGDHYGAFLRFTEAYAEKVTLESAVLHPTTREYFPEGRGYDPFLTEGLGDLLTRYGDVKRITPHAGQVLRFGDVAFEVYYSCDDRFPETLPYMNDSSTVYRMTAAGQSVLFTGDCEKSSSELLARLHGENLRSDFLQINHHGYSGGTVELYRLAAPTYSLWTTTQDAFGMRITGEKYKWIGNAIESNHYIAETLGKEHCLVADGPTKLIRFPLGTLEEILPYTPDDTDRFGA